MTTRIITEHWRIKTHISANLAGMQLGPWQGKTIKEIRKTHAQELHNFFHHPDNFNLAGAESYYDLQQRVVYEINNIFHKHSEHKILVVTHAAVIKALLAYLEKKSVAGIADISSIKNGACIMLKSQQLNI